MSQPGSKKFIPKNKSGTKIGSTQSHFSQHGIDAILHKNHGGQSLDNLGFGIESSSMTVASKFDVKSVINMSESEISEVTTKSEALATQSSGTYHPLHHQFQPAPKLSVTSFLRERILYHGPKPYIEDYFESKAKYELPRPKPKKRQKKSEEVIVPSIVVPTVGSDDSDLSAAILERAAATSRPSLRHQEVRSAASEDSSASVEISEEFESGTPQNPVKPSAIKEPEKAPSEISITEKICFLEEGGKQNPLTLKERNIGHKPVKGFPSCLDKSTGHPECLAPGELVCKAIKAEELWGIPENVPLPKDTFMELMNKIEDYPNNDYVCLLHANDASDTSKHFNPYCFKIVQFKDVSLKDYYTLSKYGLMHFTNGFSEHLSIVEFQRQVHIFDRVRRNPFFEQFRILKCFEVWRSNIRSTKSKLNRYSLDDSLFFTKRPLRKMMMELFKMSDRISTLGFLSVQGGFTYSMKEFLGNQETRIRQVYARFQTFESMVEEMTLSACRSYLIECGFSPDDYPAELAYYLRGLEVPMENLIDTAFDFLSYPGQWLTYSLQAKKRKVCERLSKFIHLIDYYVQRAYHRLMKNSALQLMCELESRMNFIPEEYTIMPKYQAKFEHIKRTNEKLSGDILISGHMEPIFDVGCSWDEESLVFKPTNEEINKCLRTLLDWWKNTIASYGNLMPSETFHPYTQPIVNGYMRKTNAHYGEGPSITKLVETDPDLTGIYETIEQIINHGMDACKVYVTSFEFVRTFCVENETTDVESFREITDVQEFRQLLEKYYKELEVIRDMQDEEDIGLFKVDNRVLRANAYPTINRCILVLHEVIPIFGANCVHALTEKILKALEILEQYPETADQYVDYLLFLDEIQEQMEGIEHDLDIAAQVYELIENYDIAAEATDLTEFIQLSPITDRLKGLVEQQVGNREKLIEELVDQFRVDTDVMLAEMDEVRDIAMAKEVLDPKTDPTPMLSKLTDGRDVLLKLQERASKFNTYQKQLKLEVTNYDELDKLIIDVKLRHQLWDSVSTWEIQREEWDTAPFQALHLDMLTREVDKYVNSIQNLEKSLPENKVVPILKQKIEAMRGLLSLIANLHNPNLRRRHWDILSEALNRNLTDESVTLKSLNEDTGVQNYAELIQEVSSQASVEFSIEALLHKVTNSWKEVEFTVVSHKDQRDVFILGGTDDIQVVLDDSNIHMATIASFRYFGPIKHKVDDWVRLLDLFGRTLDDWLTCQRNWIYLESIFCEPDIAKQFPNEAKLFSVVDKSWREIMQKTNKMPAALRAATTTGLLEQLQNNNQMLDQIMKCLSIDKGNNTANHKNANV